MSRLRYFFFGVLCFVLCGFGIPGPQGSFTGGTLTSDLDMGDNDILGANVIQPTSGQTLVLSDQSGTAALTVETTGVATIESDLHMSNGSDTVGLSQYQGGFLRVSDGSTGYSAMVQNAHALCTPGASDWSGTGWMSNGFTEVDASLTFDCSAAGLYIEQSSSGSGADYIRIDPIFSTTVEPDTINLLSVMKFQVVTPTNMRFFLGWAGTTALAMAGADDPTQNYVGVRFNTTNGNWVFCVNDNSGGATTSDTGIAAGSDVHYLVIDWRSSTDVTLYLLDEAGEELASHQFTSGGPAAGTGMSCVLGMREGAAEVKQIRQFWWGFYARD